MKPSDTPAALSFLTLLGHLAERLFGDWVRFVSPASLRADELAGLLGAVLVLPQGIAFATLAGLPPEYGLYTAIVPCIIAALISWGIALFEYLIQVPANRIGHTSLSVGQLKIMQEVIALTVFVPFSVLYLKEQIKLDYLWAGLCILGAVFFVFREKLFAN